MESLFSLIGAFVVGIIGFFLYNNSKKKEQKESHDNKIVEKKIELAEIKPHIEISEKKIEDNNKSISEKEDKIKKIEDNNKKLKNDLSDTNDISYEEAMKILRDIDEKNNN